LFSEKKKYICRVELKKITMTVVSSKEFVTNEDKYFDLTLDDRLIIQRGDNLI